MKKKFTLILASMFLCMGTAWAQLNFTFTRGTTLDNSTVEVTDIDGNEVSGVTANIAATAPSNAWNTGGAMAGATHVLCANTNTSALSGSNITYTLTVKGLSANQAFDLVTYTHVAVNSGGNYQPSNDTDIRHCNFSLSANSTEVGSITDENIWIPDGKTSKDITFEKAVAANESGALTLTLTISKGTTNNGCFYGLTGITLQTYKSKLSSLVAEAEALYNSYAPYTGKPGGYTQDAMNTLNAAITTAKAVETATAENVAALQAAIDVFSETDIIKPENGKFYRIKSVNSDNYVTAPANTGTAMSLVADASANNILYWDAEGHFLVYGTGHYTNGKNHAVYGYKDTYTVEGSKTGVAGAYAIKPGSANYWHDNGENLDVYQNGTHANCNWTIEEVTTLPVAVSAAGYATLYAPVALTIPAEGVTVYTATVKDGYLALTEVKGAIPANTGVIIEATVGTYNFAVAAEADAVESDLVGSYAKSVKNANAKVYTLQKPAENEVGFYLFKGQDTEGATTYINGFRAWVEVPNGGAAPAMFSLGRGEGTTAIDSVELTNDNVVIYDLAGRRVEKMEKGIYIVNGKKVIR